MKTGIRIDVSRRSKAGSEIDAALPSKVTGRSAVLAPEVCGFDSLGQSDIPRRNAHNRLHETIGLTEAIKLSVQYAEVVRIKTPRPSTLLGVGAVERFKEIVETLNVEVVIIGGSLTPIQQRNLERAWHSKVIDRTALILEIFGARARTYEGRLQVELAALSFQRSRLVHSWTHLERQRGGAGFLGGPGESQIELDRRQIDDRIMLLKRDLEKVTKTRSLHRVARRRVPYPIVAFVGYTNAGKSSFFNTLTKSSVLAKNMLFATLDPRMRRKNLPSGRSIILSDTVGFISELPTHLVAAFKATLEEVLEADLIIHVRDISHPETEYQKNDVEAVLYELGVVGTPENTRLIEAWNKIDLLPIDHRSALFQRANQDQVPISALTGEGCQTFIERIDEVLGKTDLTKKYALAPSDGAAIAWLHRHGRVLDQEIQGDILYVTVALTPADAGRFDDRFTKQSVVTIH